MTPIALHFYQWHQWKNNETARPRPTAAELATELASLPIEGHLFNESRFDRISSVGATGSLDTEMPPTQAIKTAKIILLAHGWTLKKETAEPTPTANFCRNSRSLTIEPVNQSGKTRIAIGLTWTFYTAAISYCP